MKHKKSILLVVSLALVMVFAFAGVASAEDYHNHGAMQGKAYNASGSSCLRHCLTMNSTDVLNGMVSGGHLFYTTKAVALTSASTADVIYRVRFLPTGGVDRRIDPTLVGNYVGDGYANVAANVRGVQTILCGSGVSGTVISIDGAFGPKTKEAIKKFQAARGFKGNDIDGVVGRKGWRALCSSNGYRYTSTIW